MNEVFQYTLYMQSLTNVSHSIHVFPFVLGKPLRKHYYFCQIHFLFQSLYVLFSYN